MKRVNFSGCLHLLPIAVPIATIGMFWLIRHPLLWSLGWLIMFGSWGMGAGMIVWLARQLEPAISASHRNGALLALFLPIITLIGLLVFDLIVPIPARSGGHAPIGPAFARIGLMYLLEFSSFMVTIILSVWGLIQLVRKRPYFRW